MAIFHHFRLSYFPSNFYFFVVWICLSNFILAAGLWSKVFVWRRANGRRRTAGELNGRRCAPARLIVVSAAAESVRVATFQRSAEQRSVWPDRFSLAKHIFRIFLEPTGTWLGDVLITVLQDTTPAGGFIVLCFGKSSVLFFFCFFNFSSKCRRFRWCYVTGGKYFFFG